MNLPEFRLAKPSVDTVALSGGFDQMTPTLDLPPGAARQMVNYECGLDGGYRRIAGYERYDGRTSPSSVTFKILPISAFLSTPSVSQTLVGGTSGATATIIGVGANYLAVTKVLVSAFITGEMVLVGGTPIGTIGSQAIALSKRQRKQYVKAASDVYRALIAAVPGYGPVRGVFGATFNGAFAVYAFRDIEQAGLRISGLNKATPSGWTAVGILAGAQGLEIEFYDGSGTAPTEGDIWDYFGATYRLHRVLLTGGSWSGADASGRLLFIHGGSNPGNQGAFNAIFNPQTYNGTTISTKYSLSANYLQPGGTYEFSYGNFGGQLESTKVYGCDGVNRCFEFDGTVCVPITTGIEELGWNINGTIVTVDKPAHIAVHQNHLMVAIGSSIIHSAIGNPYNFEAGNGAGEIATGDVITGFVTLPGSQQTGALGIYGRNHTKILYGTALAGTEPFELISFGGDFGALPRTMLQMEDVYVLDDRGVTRMKAAQEFGNFTAATLTRKIQRYINGRTGRAVFALLNRTKGQYRLFLNDKTGVYLTIANGKLIGIGTTEYAHAFTCGWSGEDASGTEHSFVGDADGYVHELDHGTSHDGEAISASFILNWNTMKSPRVRKSLRRTLIDIHDTDYAELTIGARLGPDIGAHLQDAPSDPVIVTTDMPVIDDNFNRPDASDCGPSWLNVWAKPIPTVSGRAIGTSGAEGEQVYGTTLTSADQWGEVTIVQHGSASDHVGLIFRSDGLASETSYTVVSSVVYDSLFIFKLVAGVWQYNLGLVPRMADGDRMRVECRTTGAGIVTLKVYRNGSLHLEVDDTISPILTGGYVGIKTSVPSGTEAIVDDFRAGTFVDTVVDRTITETPREDAPQWDHFTWDDFYWDAHSEAPIELEAKGTAERIQWAIRSSSDYLDPHTLTTITTHYVTRRTLR